MEIAKQQTIAQEINADLTFAEHLKRKFNIMAN
jgi:hypothetical protein